LTSPEKFKTGTGAAVAMQETMLLPRRIWVNYVEITLNRAINRADNHKLLSAGEIRKSSMIFPG
jgi:hypothetical protein